MLRKLGTLLLLGLVLAGGAAAQSGNSGTTHVVLTNDQHFTVDNGKFLSGVYECSDGGYIDISCLLGQFPPMNCPAGQAIQSIDSSLNASCINVGAGSGPAGSDTYVQYNAFGVFGADANFTWNYGSSILTLGGGGPGAATFSGTLLASLGSPSDGTIEYCTDCTAATSPCTTGGTGSMAQRLNGAWDCFGGAGGGGTPSAPDTSVQFNDGGNFGGNADFVFDKSFSLANTPIITHSLNADNTLMVMDQGALEIDLDTSGGSNNALDGIDVLSTVGPNIAGGSSGKFNANGILAAITLAGAPSGSGSFAAAVQGDIGPGSGFSLANPGTTVGGYFDNNADSQSATLSLNANTSVDATLGSLSSAHPGGSPVGDSIGAANQGSASTVLNIGTLSRAWDPAGGGDSIAVLGNAFVTGGGTGETIGGYFTLYGTLDTTVSAALIADGNGGREIVGRNAGTQNFLVDETFPTAGSAGSKKVVCVDANGKLYASSTSTDCSD